MYRNIIIVFIVIGVHYCRTQYNKPEGSECVWGNYNGTCLNINRCYTFVVDKMKKDYPPICSYKDKMPIVCCTECSSEHKDNISMADFFVDSEFLCHRRQMNKRVAGWKAITVAHELPEYHRNSCVDFVDQLPYLMKSHATYQIDKEWNKDKKCHIVVMQARAPSGGEDTKRGEYPFMALLGYGNDIDSAQWLCGGAIISNRFILTAAHCISSAKFGPVKFISLGVWKRSEPNELWQRHSVKRIIPHPEYKSPVKYHDIALLETQNPIEFTMGTLPACLHSGAAPIYKRDDDEFALGWGSLGPGKHLADILQKVILHNFTDEECAQVYKPHRLLKLGYDKTTQMCYGDREKPRDTCEGDSGGPLVRPGEVTSFAHTIIGVTSYGVQCGSTPGPAIYTRVSHYLPWIESIVWP